MTRAITRATILATAVLALWAPCRTAIAADLAARWDRPSFGADAYEYRHHGRRHHHAQRWFAPPPEDVGFSAELLNFSPDVPPPTMTAPREKLRARGVIYNVPGEAYVGWGPVIRANY